MLGLTKEPTDIVKKPVIRIETHVKETRNAFVMGTVDIAVFQKVFLSYMAYTTCS